MRTKRYNKSVGAFTQGYDSEALDASLLLMSLVRFLSAIDERATRRCPRHFFVRQQTWAIDAI